MLILTWINVQYLQKVVFGFPKGLNGQKYSLSDSQYPIKKPYPASKFLILPHFGGGGIPPAPIWNSAIPENFFEIRRMD